MRLHYAMLAPALISQQRNHAWSLDAVPGCRLNSKGNLCAIRWTRASHGHQHGESLEVYDV